MYLQANRAADFEPEMLAPVTFTGFCRLQFLRECWRGYWSCAPSWASPHTLALTSVLDDSQAELIGKMSAKECSPPDQCVAR